MGAVEKNEPTFIKFLDLPLLVKGGMSDYWSVTLL